MPFLRPSQTVGAGGGVIGEDIGETPFHRPPQTEGEGFHGPYHSTSPAGKLPPGCQISVAAAKWDEKRRLSREKPLPENNGKPWAEELDQELCRLFDEGMKKKDLCARFGRTPGAIESRLQRLGKM